MADVASSPVRRALGLVAVLVTGFALGTALGRTGVSPWALPTPSALTIGLVISGCAVGALALRSSLALRLSIALALFATAGLALTRFGPGPGIALSTAPAAVWATRTLRGGSRFLSGIPIAMAGAALGIGVASPRVYGVPSSFTLPLVAAVVALVVAAVLAALVPPGERRPEPARFDLRIALGIAALITTGFLIGFAFGPMTAFLTAPANEGGAGLRIVPSPLVLIAPILFGVIGAGVASAFRKGATVCVGLIGVVLALFLTAVSPRFAPIFLIPLSLGLVLVPSVRRAERAHEALPAATLLLATLLGMPLAAVIVRGFTRPLLGAVPGIGAATETNWGFVLGFYALLALVVLLAHLAHAYEFGFAALDPDDDRDPLPILRKGLPKFGTKA